QIFALNYQTGQEMQVSDDGAIAFKDAFIDLVNNTTNGSRIWQSLPPHSFAVIKQIDPRKMNGYPLTWQVINFNRARLIATFYYKCDENALSFFVKSMSNWTPVPGEGDNRVKRNKGQICAGFN